MLSKGPTSSFHVPSSNRLWARLRPSSSMKLWRLTNSGMIPSGSLVYHLHGLFQTKQDASWCSASIIDLDANRSVEL